MLCWVSHHQRHEFSSVGNMSVGTYLCQQGFDGYSKASLPKSIGGKLVGEELVWVGEVYFDALPCSGVLSGTTQDAACTVVRL